MSPATPVKPPSKLPSKSPATRMTRSYKAPEEPKTVAPKSASAPEATEILCTEPAELHLFDVGTSTFIMQDQEVTAVVSEVGRWQCKFGCSNPSSKRLLTRKIRLATDRRQ